MATFEETVKKFGAKASDDSFLLEDMDRKIEELRNSSDYLYGTDVERRDVEKQIEGLEAEKKRLASHP